MFALGLSSAQINLTIKQHLSAVKGLTQMGRRDDANGGGVMIGADYFVRCPIEQYEKFKCMARDNIPSDDLYRFAV